jgi:hypothetical protein
MRVLIRFALFAVTACLFGCTSVYKYTAEKPTAAGEYKEEKVDKIKADAIYDLTPRDFYGRQKELVGKMISFKGVLSDEPNLLGEGEILEMNTVTSFRGAPVLFAVQFDKPLPKPTHISDNVPFYGGGRAVQIFGKFLGNRPYLTLDGRTRLVPTIQVAMLYKENDFSYSTPEWAVDTLKTAYREGEVTIDSMRVFWENEPDSASVGVLRSKSPEWNSLQQLLAKIRPMANSKLSNLSILKKENELKGGVLSITGELQKETVVDRSDMPINLDYIEIVDSSGQRYSDFVVYIDHPLTSLRSTGKVCAFGALIVCREYINKFGFKVYLPALHCIALYSPQDSTFARPFWVSDLLVQQREKFLNSLKKVQ